MVEAAAGARAREAHELLEQGTRRYAAGDVRQAALLWRQAVERCPDDVRAQAYVAWAESRLAVEEPAGDASARPVTDPAQADDQPPFDAGAGASEAEDATPNTVDPETTVDHEIAPPDAADRRSDAAVAAPSLPVTVDGAPVPVDSAASAPAVLAGPSPRAGFITPERPLRTLRARQEEAPDGDAPVRTFLSRAPTVPNLPPVSVHELSAEVVNALVAMDHEVEASGGSGTVDELIGSAVSALERGEIDEAFEHAERACAAAGGLESSELRDHHDLLGAIYHRKLGDRERMVRLGEVPGVVDSRSAFLLSRIDGTFSIDDLLDVSGMDRVLAARLVAVMIQTGALAVD